MNKCEKCGKETNLNACPSCGTKLVQKERDHREIKNNKSNYEYMVSVIAIIGVIVIFAYRAWLGGIIFAVGAYLALTHLKEEFEDMGISSITEYVTDVLKNGSLAKKIACIIVMIAPIIIIIALYRWIFVDTYRAVDNITQRFY